MSHDLAGRDLVPPKAGPGWRLHTGPVPYWTAPLLREMAGVKHGFSTRCGGVSQGELASLNLGLHVGDDPHLVRENRRRFLEAVGLAPASLTCANQVHGVRVQRVEEKDRGKGAFTASDAFPETDALVTAIRGLTLAVFVADCVPILLMDRRQGVVAAIHAGWRGTVQRISAVTVRLMQEWFGTRPQDCVAAIGPSIGPCCYQVDERVFEAFAAVGWDTTHLFFPAGPRHWKLDLWRANWETLQELGLPAANVTTSCLCTACHPEWFFSHRQSGGRAGRMAAIIGLME